MTARKFAASIAVALSLVLIASVGVSYAGKPGTMKGCIDCHKPAPDIIRGKKVAHSQRFKTIQVDVGPLVWVVNYDANTKVTGAKDISAIKKNKEMAIVWKGTERRPLATEIKVKQPFKLAEDKLVSVNEMKALVEKGPREGGYLLVDSRPPKAYRSGHLPGAVNVPFPKLKKKGEAVLGADKGKLVIFYCGGST